MKATKAAVTKILVNAGFKMSEDGSTGRKFQVGGRTRSLGTQSEGFRVRTITSNSGRVDAYVTYGFSTFSHPSDKMFDRARELEAQAYAILGETFTQDKDSMGVYFTARI